jgi:hypothetical protein
MMEASVNDGGLALANDAEVAMLLQREEEVLDARATEIRRSDEQNDAAIARQLAQLDMECSPLAVVAAPAAYVEGDEALARSLQAEEQRRIQPVPAVMDGPPLAHARVVYPARESRAAMHRFVSDAADVVGQIGTWFELRVREATRGQAAEVDSSLVHPADLRTASAAASAATVAALPLPIASAQRCGAREASAPALSAAYARPVRAAPAHGASARRMPAQPAIIPRPPSRLR